MNKKLRFHFVLLALFLLGAGCVSENARLYEEAQELCMTGRYNEAVSKLFIVAEGEKKGALKIKALFRLGEIHYLNLDKPKKSLEYFLQVSSEDSGGKKGLKAHKYMADIYLDELGEHELAILQYQQIMSDYKSLIKKDEYYFLIAMAYFKKSDYTQATIEFQTFLENYPESDLAFDAHLQIANSLFITGKREEALDLFLKLHLEAPEGRYDYDLWLAIAICYEELGKLDLALAEYLSLLQRYPKRRLLTGKKIAIEKRIRKKISQKGRKR